MVALLHSIPLLEFTQNAHFAALTSPDPFHTQQTIFASKQTTTVYKIHRFSETLLRLKMSFKLSLSKEFCIACMSLRLEAPPHTHPCPKNTGKVNSGIAGVNWILMRKNEPLFPEASPPIQTGLLSKPWAERLGLNNRIISGEVFLEFSHGKIHLTHRTPPLSGIRVPTPLRHRGSYPSLTS